VKDGRRENVLVTMAMLEDRVGTGVKLNGHLPCVI
jgi:hypothetical protein